MSRVEPGRYILLSLADRDALVAALGEHELTARVKWAPFQDVRSEEECGEDAGAILTVAREQQLNDEELGRLLTIGFGATCGRLGGNEATSQIRDVVEARRARQKEES